MDKQLEPWEGYRGPPVPEGTDASQILVLRRASEWRDYDPSLHYVNCSRGSKPGSGVGILGGSTLKVVSFRSAPIPQAQATTAEISRNQETSLDVMTPGKAGKK